MTVLAAIQDATTVLGLEKPSAVYSSAEREHVELAALANEIGQRIGRAYEWELLNRIATFTGDGSTVAFDLPSDFDRMVKDAQLWSSSLETPLRNIHSRNEWLGLDVQAFDFVINAWIKFGGQIHIKPALASGVTVKTFYQSDQIAQANDLSLKAAFTADNDVFRLSERLLKLGIIWQWRANKGLPYEEDLETYEELLTKEISDDKGARVLVAGRRRVPRDVTVAFPQAIAP